MQQDIVPGLEIPIHFTATQTGKWEIVCTQLCGLGHYNMKAYLEVVSAGFRPVAEAAVRRLVVPSYGAAQVRGETLIVFGSRRVANQL